MSNVYCGLKKVPKGSKLGTVDECAKLGKIGLYGKHKVDDKHIEIALGKKPLTPEQLRLKNLKELVGKKGKLKRLKNQLEFDKKLTEDDKYKLSNEINKLQLEIENFNVYKVEENNIEKAKEVEKEVKEVKKILKKKVNNDKKDNIKIIDSVKKIDNENQNLLVNQTSILKSIEDELYSDKKISKPKKKKIQNELAVIKNDIHKNRSYDIIVSENIEKVINNVDFVKENLLLDKIQKDIMKARLNDLKVAKKINKVEKQLKLPNESKILKKDNEVILKEQVKTVNIIKDKIKKDEKFEEEIEEIEMEIPKKDLEKELLVNQILNFVSPLKQFNHINKNYLFKLDLGDLEGLLEKLHTQAYGLCKTLEKYNRKSRGLLAKKENKEQYKYNRLISLLHKIENNEIISENDVDFIINYLENDMNIADETKNEILDLLEKEGYVQFEDLKGTGSLYNNIKNFIKYDVPNIKKKYGYGLSKSKLHQLKNLKILKGGYYFKDHYTEKELDEPYKYIYPYFKEEELKDHPNYTEEQLKDSFDDLLNRIMINLDTLPDYQKIYSEKFLRKHEIGEYNPEYIEEKKKYGYGFKKNKKMKGGYYFKDFHTEQELDNPYKYLYKDFKKEELKEFPNSTEKEIRDSFEDYLDRVFINLEPNDYSVEFQKRHQLGIYNPEYDPNN